MRRLNVPLTLALTMPLTLPFALSFALPLVVGMEFGRLAGEPAAKARRVVADEVMRAIGELSGQEYANLYASDVKTRLAAGDGGA